MCFFSIVCLCRKPHLNIGTIGHVDHGKTTLTAAITKVWVDFFVFILKQCRGIPPFIFFKG